MKKNLRPWHLIVGLVLACAGVIGLLYLARNWRQLDGAGLARRAPASSEVMFYVDVAALRKSGALDMLAGARAIEESEYQRFVRETQFDYRNDLDGVLLTFQKDSSLYLVTGKLNWPALRDYIVQSGGSCIDAVCSVRSSVSDRFISFMPLRGDLLAIGVSSGRWGVQSLVASSKFGGAASLPASPVWMYLSRSALARPDSFPAGTQLFVKSLEGNDSALLRLDPDGAHFKVRMEVNCKSSSDADLLVVQFVRITDVLRKMIVARGQEPNMRDLSGVLTSGVFERKDKLLIGTWPVQREFFETLANGAR